MKITPDTTLKRLIDEYPFLIDYLPTLSPEYKQLKNPVMRETMFRVATIKRVAANGSFTSDTTLSETARANTGEPSR